MFTRKLSWLNAGQNVKTKTEPERIIATKTNNH
jgi:hypothetical protein